jgi:fucose permease
MPLIIWTALSMAAYSGCFVNLMSSTMAISWDSNKQFEVALFAMIPLGIGEMIGGLIFGSVNDKMGQKAGITYCLIMTIIAFAMLFAYIEIYKFSVLAFFMTLIWGLQDSAVNTMTNCILGFEFDSKIIPFSVYKFVQSIFVFIFYLSESFIK